MTTLAPQALPLDTSLHMTQFQPLPQDDTEHMELRQELIDKESILVLEQQRALLEEVKIMSMRKDADIENLRMQQMKESARTDALENALSRTSARKVVLEREVQEKDMEIRRLVENIGHLRSEHASAMERVIDQDRELKTISANLLSANSYNMELQKQLDSQNAVVHDLQQRFEALTDDNVLLQARAEKAEEAATTMETQIAELRKENSVLSKAIILNEQIARQSLTASKELAKKILQLDRVVAEVRRQKDFATGHLELLLDETLSMRQALTTTPRAVCKLRAICKAAAFTSRLMALKQSRDSHAARQSRDNAHINESVNRLTAEEVSDIAALVDNTSYNSMRSQDAITTLALKAAVPLECNFVKSISGVGQMSKQMRNKWAFVATNGKKSLAEMVKELRTDLRILSETCHELQKVNGELKDSVLHKNSECVSLQSQVSSMKAEKSFMEQDIEALNRRVSEMHDSLMDLNITHDAKCREFGALLSSLKQCESELDQRINEIASLKSRIVIMTESMDERERKNMQLERDIQRLQGNMRSKEAEIESTKRIVDQLAVESQNTRREAEEKLRILRETEVALERERAERAERARRRMMLLGNRSAVEDDISNQIEGIARDTRSSRVATDDPVGRRSYGYEAGYNSVFERSHAPSLGHTRVTEPVERDIASAMEHKGMIDRSVSFSIHGQPHDISGSQYNPRSPSVPASVGAPITASPSAVARASERLTSEQMRNLMSSVGTRG